LIREVSERRRSSIPVLILGPGPGYQACLFAGGPAPQKVHPPFTPAMLTHESSPCQHSAKPILTDDPRRRTWSPGRFWLGTAHGILLGTLFWIGLWLSSGATVSRGWPFGLGVLCAFAGSAWFLVLLILLNTPEKP